MGAESFQLFDGTKFYNSMWTRDFTELYHQQNAQLNQADKIVELFFGKIFSYYQIGNSYLQFDIEF